MQESSNNQLKYSMRIDWLYGIYNKDSSILYVNCIAYILYITKTYNQLYTHTHTHTYMYTGIHFFFLRELVVNYLSAYHCPQSIFTF